MYYIYIPVPLQSYGILRGLPGPPKDLYDLAAAICSERESEEADDAMGGDKVTRETYQRLKIDGYIYIWLRLKM